MQLLDEKEAAEILRLSPATLRQWRWQGRGPRYRKLGRAVRYAQADLDAWAERQARRSTSDPGPEAESRPAA